MKKSRKKSKTLKKSIIFVFILLVIIVLFLNYDYSLFNNTEFPDLNIFSEYPVIKKDSNKNYPGIGQVKVNNKDGYFTTFTTEENYKKTYIEYKQNGNSSWSNKEYWGDTMSENGCGITVMSIILSGYGKNYTPEDLRKKYYPVMDYENFSVELSSTFGIANSDFYYDSVHLSNDSIIDHLKTNRPIVVCVWNKPSDNRWTTASHYMALLASDDNNMVYVSYPNGLKNDCKSSGWYSIDEISPYIAKALYIEEFI